MINSCLLTKQKTKKDMKDICIASYADDTTPFIMEIILIIGVGC